MKINNVCGKTLDTITLKLFEPKHYCCMYGGASPCYADFFLSGCDKYFEMTGTWTSGYKKCIYRRPITEE